MITIQQTQVFTGVSTTYITCPPGDRCAASAQASWPWCTAASCQYYGPVSISGTVFKDTNNNRVKDAFEAPSTDPYTISVSPSAGTQVVKSGPNYIVTGIGNTSLASGTYTVRIQDFGSSQLTEPASGNSFAVQAGRNQGQSTVICSTGGSANAQCVGDGSISNLHFGLSSQNPWIQSIGLDIRKDSGFQQEIPQNATCGAFASLPGEGGSPGIIYSGESSTSFGNGQASSTNWIVGGPTYPSSYTPTRPNLIRTSYNYLRSVAQSAAITPVDISAYCGGGGISNCALLPSLPNGLYIANGNLNLTGATYTFPANKNFVILVNGDLSIRHRILVPGGSTATFSSAGNITVDRSVGQSSASSTASDIEGFYSTDKNFIVDGIGSCGGGADLRLNIAGAVVVNAGFSGGTFQNNRNLCEGNAQCPAFAVKERLDFVLNAPEFIKHPSYIWQESAP